MGQDRARQDFRPCVELGLLLAIWFFLQLFGANLQRHQPEQAGLQHLAGVRPEQATQVQQDVPRPGREICTIYHKRFVGLWDAACE